MDTATLVSALQHTLNPDKATRQQAEAALSQVRAACLSFSRDEESPRGPAASRRRLARNAATLRSGSPSLRLQQVQGTPGFLAELLQIAATDGACCVAVACCACCHRPRAPTQLPSRRGPGTQPSSLECVRPAPFISRMLCGASGASAKASRGSARRKNKSSVTICWSASSWRRRWCARKWR